MINNIIRTESGNEGTFGKFIIADKVFVTAEPPWEDNERNISCIPFGEYECEIVDSPKYGKVYAIKDVPGRSHILIHWGNWAGDESLGFRSDTDGCVVIGIERAVIGGQKAVARSKDAFKEFMDSMDNKPFKLMVSGFDVW